jgi:hypothetical protein
MDHSGACSQHPQHKGEQDDNTPSDYPKTQPTTATPNDYDHPAAIRGCPFSKHPGCPRLGAPFFSSTLYDQRWTIPVDFGSSGTLIFSIDDFPRIIMVNEKCVLFFGAVRPQD